MRRGDHVPSQRGQRSCRTWRSHISGAFASCESITHAAGRVEWTHGPVSAVSNAYSLAASPCAARPLRPRDCATHIAHAPVAAHVLQAGRRSFCVPRGAWPGARHEAHIEGRTPTERAAGRLPTHVSSLVLPARVCDSSQGVCSLAANACACEQCRDVPHAGIQVVRQQDTLIRPALARDVFVRDGCLRELAQLERLPRLIHDAHEMHTSAARGIVYRLQCT